MANQAEGGMKSEGQDFSPTTVKPQPLPVGMPVTNGQHSGETGGDDPHHGVQVIVNGVSGYHIVSHEAVHRLQSHQNISSGREEQTSGSYPVESACFPQGVQTTYANGIDSSCREDGNVRQSALNGAACVRPKEKPVKVARSRQSKRCWWKEEEQAQGATGASRLSVCSGEGLEHEGSTSSKTDGSSGKDSNRTDGTTGKDSNISDGSTGKDGNINDGSTGNDSNRADSSTSKDSNRADGCSDKDSNGTTVVKSNLLTCNVLCRCHKTAGNGVAQSSEQSVLHKVTSSERSNLCCQPDPTSYQDSPPPLHREEGSDLLDLVDEGAVCDFDKNVPVEDSSFSFLEDTSISPTSAEANGHYHNGHALSSDDNDGGRPHHSRQAEQYYQACHQYGSSSDADSDGDHDSVPNVVEGVVGRWAERRQQLDMSEDNGDFIDADLPAVSSRLLSSSAGSASLSSSNGDAVEAQGACSSFSAGDMSSRRENDLSGGSDKEINQRHDSPVLFAVVSPTPLSTSQDKGFDSVSDNFLTSRKEACDGVFGNSSESENEEEHTEMLCVGQHGAPDRRPMLLEGAGVAEAPACSRLRQLGLDHVQLGAEGMDLSFGRLCCLQSNAWHPGHMASSLLLPCLAGQSAARHGSCPNLHELPGEGEAGGACALPVNNLSRLHPCNTGSRAMEPVANGFDDVAPSNFINDQSNQQQKVFVKFPMVQENPDLECGSGAGQVEVKCENDNILYPCPPAMLGGHRHSSAGEKGGDLDQACLGPNLEAFQIFLHSQKEAPREGPWQANSESGVSEPIYEEICEYPCHGRDCSVPCIHNTFKFSMVKRGGKDVRKKKIVCRPIENGSDVTTVDRVMIWNEYEAYLLQVKQIGMSACGQTAVLNLLKAFDLPAEKDDVCREIHVNLRKEKASIPEYLASRAVAGTTAEDLLSGVERLTKGEVRGRFFHFWPPRQVQLLSWLSHWMKKGAVPIATLNLQLGVTWQQIPDAWHHQMVYGVGSRGVYLTNPLEIVCEDTLMEQLTSDSVLLVRRQDVVSRFQPSVNLALLICHHDPRWCTMNVLGQVVNVLREHNMPSVPGYRAQLTSHIRIPAVYRAGITLYVRHNSSAWKALRDAADLPLKTASQDTQPQH